MKNKSRPQSKHTSSQQNSYLDLVNHLRKMYHAKVNSKDTGICIVDSVPRITEELKKTQEQLELVAQALDYTREFHELKQ